MRKFLFLIFLVYSMLLTAQAEKPLHISELAVHMGLFYGQVSNQSVEDAIAKDIISNKWKQETDISDDIMGLSVGATIGTFKNFRIALSGEYVSAFVNSTPSDLAYWTGWDDEIQYIYTRWSTNLLLQYHYEIFKKFSIYGEFGPNFDVIRLQKRPALFDFFTFEYKPDSSITIARTNTIGVRMAIGANYKITSKFGLELNVFKDILNPRTCNNIKLDYNLLAVELKFKIYFKNFPKNGSKSKLTN